MLGHLYLIFKGMRLLSDFKSSKIKITNYKTITNTNRNYRKKLQILYVIKKI